MAPAAAVWAIFRWGSLPSRVWSTGVRGSPQPVRRMAWWTYTRPDRGSRMQPPMQVAAPPKGSISVGWLWVSFLNMSSQSCSLPSTWAGTWMEQALISSLSSSSGSSPRFFSTLVPMVARSIRVWGRLAAFSDPYTSSRADR